MSIRIASLQRYPVKGLSAEPLDHVALAAGGVFPGDRAFAIENGPSGFDPAAPAFLPKAHFLMLMRDEWLAGLRTHFDDASNVLTIHHNGRIAAQGDLETAEGRAAIESFFTTSFAGQIKGPPKVLSSSGHSFSDVARKVVSIINLASVRAIENMVGAPVHPLRFRANVYVEGWPAWSEFDLLDRTLSIGETRLKVVKRIEPDTVDLIVPSMILQPLVENSIKHGFSRKVGPGSITIRSYRENGRAIIEVDDDGMGFFADSDQPMTSGIGLANVRERLRVIYGTAYQLKLTSEPGKGTLARIEVPELAEAHPISA